MSTDKQSRKAFCFIGPGMSLLLVFFVAPLLLMLVYSFLQRATYGGVVWHFNIDNYARLFGFPNEAKFRDWSFTYMDIYLESIFLALTTVVSALFIGYPAAYYIARQKGRRKIFLLFLATVPFFANALIRVYAWILVLRADGLINNILMGLGVIDAPLKMLFTDGAVVLGLLYQYLPFMVLPLYASIEKLDFRLLEASYDLGATRLQTIRRVILPITMPGIVAGSILVFIPSLGNFVVPTFLGGAKDLKAGTLLEQSFLATRDWPFGSAAAFFLMAIVLGCLFLYAFFQRREAQQRATTKGIAENGEVA